MKKEQEKAIKIISKYLNSNEICGTRNFKEALETVLSMLKEKDKKIEHQIEKRNNQKAELAILNEKQKEMNKLINTIKSYKGQMKKERKRIKSLEKEAQGYFETTIIQSEKFDKEIKKKDKIIYEMIGSFIDLGFGFEYCNNDDRCINDCDKCIEQYFKRKATNDG